jgi:hypothetical protein
MMFNRVTDRPLGMGLTLSRDRRLLLFTRVDQFGSDLMWIRDFTPPQ